ncbi:hypothetical protein SAMN06295905_2140 [Devosia lucknowensis]|uniref:Uncharacterized protein n=1 Tax=Devosia lucknowensis TaxID=1096929 RepID=A0A1Y6FGZ3_9HYPH|nr:hypothetical protein [Devosia lucknowensis]SMQ72851.1 hypothetical protein SAMN06295905_2140 [Devosia lucknowensis]
MSAPSITPTVSRRFPHLPLRMIGDYAIFAAMVAGGAVASIMLITVVVSFFRPIEASGWDIAQQLGNWFALGIAAHVGAREFWLYVTHGQTRRNFFGEASIFVAIFALVLAVFYSVGFWVEAPLYGVTGWPQLAHQPTLYTDVLALPMVLLESWLTYFLWGAAGLAIGAAFYRSLLWGSVMCGLCLFVAQLASLGLGQDAGPVGSLVRTGVVPAEPNLALAIAVHVVGGAVLLCGAWIAMKDAPIHNRK